MSIVAVSRLHHLMRSYQIHAIGRQPVMLDERMLLNVFFDLAFTLRLWRMLHFLPVFDAALDEMVRAAVPITQSRLIETRSSQRR